MRQKTIRIVDRGYAVIFSGVPMRLDSPVLNEMRDHFDKHEIDVGIYSVGKDALFVFGERREAERFAEFWNGKETLT